MFTLSTNNNVNALHKTTGRKLPKYTNLKSFFYRIFNVVPYVKTSKNIHNAFLYHIRFNANTDLRDFEHYTLNVRNRIYNVLNSKKEDIDNNINLQIILSAADLHETIVKTKIVNILMECYLSTSNYDSLRHNIEFVTIIKDANLQYDFNVFYY